jgi:SSS family solute:Na+ symporter
MLLYSIWGGFRAIVYSDFIQAIIMMIAVWLVVFFSWYHYGGLDFLSSQLPSSHWDPTGGNDWGALIIWGAIALGTLVDPNFHQRVQAARDVQTARWGIFIATCIWFIFDMATTLGGLYARSILPEALPEQAYLMLGVKILPEGLRGIFLAGILATILSTVDSYLFTAASTLNLDLLQNTSPRRIQLSMLLMGLLAWLIAPLFSGSVVKVWQVMGGLISACLLPSLLWGLWKPNTLSEKGFLLSLGCGVSSMALYAIIKVYLGLSWDEFYLGLISSILGLIWALTRRTSVVAHK